MSTRRLLALLVAAVALAACGTTVLRVSTVVRTTTGPTVTRIVRTAKPRIVVRNHVHTVTHTVTVTRTVTAGTSTGPGGFASTYPLSFEASFAQSCVQSGATNTTCTCALRKIEASVSYSTELAAAHNIFTGNPPRWFTAARSACGA